MKKVLNSKTKIVVTYDRTGKEIYNNSKIKYYEHNGVIKYNESHCCFEIHWDDGIIRNLTSEFAKKSLEVVE